jgi:hypothetical protein
MAKKCQQCGKKLPKGRKRFCRNKCKDRWHNKTNPRGKFAHLNPDNQTPEDVRRQAEDDCALGWDAHKDTF